MQPCRQSISSKLSRATSLARIPSRTSSRMIARSRRRRSPSHAAMTPRDVVLGQEARDRGEPPPRRVRHGVVESRRTATRRDQEAQERADGDADAFEATDRYGAGASQHICPDRRGVIGRRIVAERSDERADRAWRRCRGSFPPAPAARAPTPYTRRRVAAPVSAGKRGSAPRSSR